MAVLKVYPTAITLICVAMAACLSLAGMSGAACALDGNATLTPTPAPTPLNGSTITPTPAPVPTPAPRQVFSNWKWEADHVSVMVTNNGAPIQVEAYIESPGNRNIVPVDAGAAKRVSTLPVSAEPGQIISFGFTALENGTQIDRIEKSIVVPASAASPTPPPETAIVTGKVVDASTREPIVGAEVIFTSKTFDKQYPSAFTDSSGTFTTIGKLFPDNYYITVKASGFDTLTSLEVRVTEGSQQISDPLALRKISAATSTALPGPTPGSFLDAWASLLYSPATCIGTVAVGLGAIVSAIAVYEWILRQRERRKGGEDKK
jgi:hypothetical protein